MSPEELRSILAPLNATRGTRTIARLLGEHGAAPDPDGSRLRKMLSGKRVIDELTAAAARRLNADPGRSETRDRDHQGALQDLDRRLRIVRERAPRASLAYALVLITLARHGRSMIQADIGLEVDDDPNSATVSKAILFLEDLGQVAVDRTGPVNRGFPVTLRPIPEAGGQAPP